jgi:hypothetical protein
MRRRVRRFTCSSVPPRQPQGVTGTRPVTGDRSGVRHRAAAYLAMAFHGSRRIDECGRPLAAHEARHRAWPDPDRFGVRDSGAGVVCQHRCLSDSVTAGLEPLPLTRQAFDLAWGTPSGVEGMKVQGAGALPINSGNNLDDAARIRTGERRDFEERRGHEDREQASHAHPLPEEHTRAKTQTCNSTNGRLR